MFKTKWFFLAYIIIIITITVIFYGCSTEKSSKDKNIGTSDTPAVSTSLPGNTDENIIEKYPAALLKFIGESLNKDYRSLTPDDFRRVDSLDFNIKKFIEHGDNPDLVYDFTILTHLPNLNNVTIENIKIKDYSVLNKCPLTFISFCNLTDNDTAKFRGWRGASNIGISKSSISNLNFLEDCQVLSSLSIVDMPDFPLVDVLNSDFFLKKASLQALCLENMSITGEDIASIHQLKWINRLLLLDNKIENIIDFPDAPSLETLELLYNPIKSINIPVDKVPKLKMLDLQCTDIEDLNQIKGLDNMEWICLLNTKVKSVAPLKRFKKLKRIIVDSRNINDIDEFKGTGVFFSSCD